MGAKDSVQKIINCLADLSLSQKKSVLELAGLGNGQIEMVVRFGGGETLAAIASDEGVTCQAISVRISSTARQISRARGMFNLSSQT